MLVFPPLLKRKIDTDNLHFLQFLYPHAIITNNLQEVRDKTVIWVGTTTQHNLNMLERLCKSYIIITKSTDLKLLQTKDYLNYFFPQSDKYYEYYNTKLDEFLPLLKNSIALNKPLPLKKESEVKIYELFGALVESQKELLRVYFNVAEQYPLPVITQSIFTFLQKVKDKDNLSSSKSYNNLLKRARVKFGDRIDTCIVNYIKSTRNESGLLYLLLELNRVNR